MNPATRLQGIVRAWKDRFGFILGQDGEDYFVHIGSLHGQKRLALDQLVEFSAVPGKKGLAAKDVCVVVEK